MRIPWAYARIVIGTVLLSMSLVLVISGTSYFVAPVTSELGIPRSAFMGHYSLFTLLSIVTMPLAGRLEPRWGARRILIIGGLWTGLSLAGMSISSDLWMFYLFGACAGVTLFATTALMNVVLINIWFAKHRGLVLGMAGLGAALGGMVSSSVLPPLIVANGWRFGYILLGILFATLMLIAAALLLNRPEDVGLQPYGAAEVTGASTDSSTGVSYRTAIRSAPFWLLFGGVVVFMTINAGSEQYPAHLVDNGMPIETLASVMSLYYLGTFAVTLLTGYLADKIGLVKTFALLWVCASAGWTLFILGGTSEAAQTTGLFLVLMATGSGMLPSLFTLKMFGGRDYPGIVGVIMPAGTVGLALGGPLWALAHDLTKSYAPAFGSAIVVFGIGLILVALALHRARTRWGAVPDDELGTHQGATGPAEASGAAVR